VDKESEGFSYLRQKLPRVRPKRGKEFSSVHKLHNCEAKKREGIFVGPQIAQLFEDHDFSTKLNSTESRAWNAFENICRNFLSTEKAEN